nr:immunoglobulin heavy chain junction region [Macaca mulatta]MOY27049.1 immunoglobulin heavy chain junction region [Macaca mulatta]MOY28804.1 immunoglobulin heavy chain junction region [Macaca mulatta]
CARSGVIYAWSLDYW